MTWNIYKKILFPLPKDVWLCLAMLSKEKIFEIVGDRRRSKSSLMMMVQIEQPKAGVLTMILTLFLEVLHMLLKCKSGTLFNMPINKICQFIAGVICSDLNALVFTDL